MFNQEHCSPDVKKQTISCYDINILRKIAKIINKEDKKVINIRLGKKKLYERLSQYFSEESKCKNEICWIKEIKDGLNDMEYENFMDYFKPVIPDKWQKNKNQWLTTIDIDDVLTQYQEKHQKFKYMGANPIDFSLKKENKCITGGNMCNIDVRSIKKNYRKIGIVFNTDKSNEPGQHWFSLFIDLFGDNRIEDGKKKPTIYYFDSAQKITPTTLDSKVPSEIQDLVTKLQKQDKKLDFLWNDDKLQYKDTECGVYCIHFIINMLEGVDFQDYIDTKINDSEMEKFRLKYFINVK
jgi:hypothetical protein